MIMPGLTDWASFQVCSVQDQQGSSYFAKQVKSHISKLLIKPIYPQFELKNIVMHPLLRLQEFSVWHSVCAKGGFLSYHKQGHSTKFPKPWNKNDLNALVKYDGLNQVCQQVSYGIQALFGPSDLILGSHVQSLCDALVMLSKTPKLERFSILTSTRISLI